MELEVAARREALRSEAIRGYVQERVFKYRLEEKVDKTGKTAMVVNRNNGWATPDPVTTQEYPILTVKCYADCSRDDNGNELQGDAEARAWALYRASDPLFRRARGVWWGGWGLNAGLFVVTAQRWSEPSLVTKKDKHGQNAGDPLGDSVYVYTEYALQVIHSDSVGMMDGVPTAGAMVLTGHGPPPDGMVIPDGVEYIDLDTGDVYEAEG